MEPQFTLRNRTIITWRYLITGNFTRHKITDHEITTKEISVWKFALTNALEKGMSFNRDEIAYLFFK